MRTIWGASISRLSDAEAGRFLKALYTYVERGEEYNGGGREELLVAQALETLRAEIAAYKENEAIQKIKEAEKKEKRRQAALSRWHMQTDAKSSICMQVDASACKCIDVDANAWENQKNIQNTEIKENPLKGAKEKPQKRFSPPSAEEVAAYCRERGNRVNAQAFVDFYASKGWKVGGQPMKDWQASVRTWEQRDSYAQQPRMKVTGAAAYAQRDYTEEELDSVSADLIEEARALKAAGG